MPLPKLLENNWQTFKRILCSPVNGFNYSCKKHMLLAALQVVEWSQSLGGEKLVFFFFCLLFLASQNHCSRASKGAEGCQVLLSFFLSFFLFFFFDFKYLLHSRGGEKMAEQTACKRGAQKKKGGWMSCRQGMDCKQRQIKKKGGEGGRERQP